MSQSPVLMHYAAHANKPIKLYCDASSHGVGACLMYIVDNGVEWPVTIYIMCAIRGRVEIFLDCMRSTCYYIWNQTVKSLSVWL